MQRVRRERAVPLDGGRGSEVTVTLAVTVKVVGGRISEPDLARWATEGLEKYHNFRGGFINTGRHPMSGITAPTVIVL